jgi:hypothetical protein
VEVKDHFYVRGAAVSEAFRSEVLRLYPQLAVNKRWLGFFELLCFNTFHEEETRHQVIPFDLVRLAAGLPEGTTPKQFPTGPFLEEFRASVLPDLKVGGYAPCRSARTIVEPGFSAEMRQVLARELRSGHRAERKVDFLTGEPIYRQATRLERLELAAARQRQSPVQCDAAQRVLAYMNVPRSRLFRQKVEENRDAAFSAAERVDEGRTGASRVDAELRLLNRIALQPQPFYAPSKAGNTVRLSALNPSMVRLSNSVKAALIEGWATFDLRHAQLAIIAKDWGLDDVVALLRDPTFDLWGSLTSLFPSVAPERAKRAVKTALYSLCYGAARKNVSHALANELGVEHRTAARFFKHRVTEAIGAYRTAVGDVILAAGGVRDCFERWIPCIRRGDVLSVMAQHSQSQEMQLLLPAITVAEERRKELVITLWEHDGFSMHAFRRQALNAAMLVEAVDGECERLGYATRLVPK